MSLDRISIVSVPVSDRAAALRFDKDVVAFSLLRGAGTGRDRRRVQMAPPGGTPSITLVIWFDAMSSGCQKGPVIRAPDVDAARKALKGRGTGVSDVKSAPWGRYFIFEDPDGNGRVVQGPAAPDGSAV